ncbi:ArsR/SmtB family transcription factor [Cohnella thailandensis]|uniref:Winged helix-turn-helix transcriptional regulator n=1 Tax=Cohnella thailandensis TaxID=557557 RepID=A0A841T4C6_9BACL|nr:metalloregulator ArsR/SmtB family transcription factor [Cohnella thailandensis]MBB6636930.1 winged helix-turn-helix transcriptional regulator [Cohnella thailandensis]MBP1973188.1 DNA-binding transcriptional ArsR family regulator [Cohnella thailandensis]
MEPSILEECEDACVGTQPDLGAVREQLLDESSVIEMAEWFKALSDPTRVKLIGALLERELCVHDLAELLEMGQSAVSHQLRYLRNVRMVKRRKVGKTVYYSLDDSHIEQIFHVTLQHLKHK